MGWPTQKAVGQIVLCALKRIDSSEICLDFAKCSYGIFFKAMERSQERRSRELLYSFKTLYHISLQKGVICADEMPLSTYKRVWLHFWELKTFNITLFNNCSLWAYINCVIINSTVFSKLCFNRLNVCFKNVLLKNSHYEPWKVQFIALMAQSIPSVIFPSGHSSSPVFPQWGICHQ